MAAAAAADWTVVRRRGRHRDDAPVTASHPDAPLPLLVSPIPWSPSDPSLDPARVSRLIDRSRAAITHVAASRLYHRVLLPDFPLCRRLRLLAPARLSLLGVGSFESSSPSSLMSLPIAPGTDDADLANPGLSLHPLSGHGCFPSSLLARRGILLVGATCALRVCRPHGGENCSSCALGGHASPA